MTVETQEFKTTGLGPLPSDWEVVQLNRVLGEVDTRVCDSTVTESPHCPVLSLTREFGLIPQTERFGKRIATKDVGNYKVVEKGQVVYNPYVIWEGAVHILRHFRHGLVSPVYPVMRVDATTADAYFVDQWLRMPYAISAYNRFAAGAVNRRRSIRKKDFLSIEIPLPSLYEQKKNAHILSSLQTAIEKTRAVISATKELQEALLEQIFTYGPVTIDEAENVPIKEMEIGFVPEQWEVAKLGEVVTFSSKPRDLNLNTYDRVPFVPMEYIPDSSIGLIRYEMKKPEEISSGTFFFKGDLLIAKITPSFENGKQCIADNLPSDFAYATTEVWPFHESNKADLKYLFYCLKRKELRADITTKMEGTTGRKRVPRHALLNLCIPLPPLSIQRQIGDMLSPIDEKIEAEENKKQSLEALFQTLLKNLMTGKIRVKNLEVPV